MNEEGRKIFGWSCRFIGGPYDNTTQVHYAERPDSTMHFAGLPFEKDFDLASFSMKPDDLILDARPVKRVDYVLALTVKDRIHRIAVYIYSNAQSLR
jgi:hypothetical protein